MKGKIMGYVLSFDNYPQLSGGTALPEPRVFDKNEKKTAISVFSRCHMALVAYLIIASVVITVAQIVLISVFGIEKAADLLADSNVLWILQIVSMYVIAFPLFLLMIRGIETADREKSTVSFKEFIGLLFVAEALMMLGSTLSEYVINYFYELFGIEVANSTSDLIMDTDIGMVILVVVIIGPIVEEMIFRKALIDRMSVYGDRLAVVVSSVAFGLFHGNFSQLFYATALGILLGYVYTKTHRSIYNCLIHMAVNFMGTVPALLVTDSLNRIMENPEGVGLEGAAAEQYIMDTALVSGVSLAQYAIAFIGIIILISATIRRSYRFSRECDVRIPAWKLPRVVIFNIGTILFVLFSAASLILSVVPLPEEETIFELFGNLQAAMHNYFY